jgi:hypothetical protein
MRGGDEDEDEGGSHNLSSRLERSAEGFLYARVSEGAEE